MRRNTCYYAAMANLCHSLRRFSIRFLYLLRHSGTVIDKDELMREIWTDTIVEENNLNKNISTLRHILGEKPGEHRFITTMPGKGYKFVSEVKEIDDAEKSEEGSAVAGGLDPDKLQILDYKFQDKNQKPKTEDRLRNFKITLFRRFSFIGCREFCSLFLAANSA